MKFELYLPLTIFSISGIFAVIFFKGFLFKQIRKNFSKSEAVNINLLLFELDYPFQLFLMSLVVLFGLHLTLTSDVRPALGLTVLKNIAVVFAAIITSRIFVFLIKNTNLIGNEGSKSIASIGAKLFVVILASLVVMDSLGISITPILASLGVGSLAVALALQDTLGNFFAGLFIIVDKPFVVGDRIQFGEGTGVVQKIGLRSTRILGPLNNTLIIPNTKLSSAVLTNFNLPQPVTQINAEILFSNKTNIAKLETFIDSSISSFQLKSPGEINYNAQSINADGIQYNFVITADRFENRDSRRHDFLIELLSNAQSQNIEFGSKITCAKN